MERFLSFLQLPTQKQRGMCFVFKKKSEVPYSPPEMGSSKMLVWGQMEQ